MYHDGKTYIWIPSALTLNRLTVETAALVNAVHTAVGLPAGFVAGETNPHYLDLNDLDMGGAPFTRDATPGMAVCGPIENLGYLPLDYVSLIVAFGGDVEGFPVWFEVDDRDATCPLDETKTWLDWGQNTDSPQGWNDPGGKWFRSSEDYAFPGNSGQPIDASAWVSLRAAGGLVVKTKAEYLAIQAANQPSLP